MNKLKQWWKKSTLNEKLMYSLIIVLIIGISTRWRYAFNEIGDAFNHLFKTEQTATKQIQAPIFKIPDVPTMLQGTPNAPLWLAEHFWDNANLADTAYLHYPNNLETAVNEWGRVLTMVDDTANMKKYVHSFLDKAAADSAVMQLALNKLEWALYDPNSPSRNFEAYIAALQWMIATDKLTDLEKIRPANHLTRTLKNRQGTKAYNFQYVTADNKSGSLYHLKTPYTLVFFNNPGCPACREYIKQMAASEIINEMTTNGQLQILGIFPDNDEKEWRSDLEKFPKQWINGYDKGQQIEAAGNYELNVIPTLLLLDPDKVVLLKDATPSRVESYLSAHKK